MKFSILSTAKVLSNCSVGVEFLNGWPYPRKNLLSKEKKICSAIIFIQATFCQIGFIKWPTTGKKKRSTLKTKNNRFAQELFNIKVRTSFALFYDTEQVKALSMGIDLKAANKLNRGERINYTRGRGKSENKSDKSQHLTIFIGTNSL